MKPLLRAIGLFGKEGLLNTVNVMAVLSAWSHVAEAQLHRYLGNRLAVSLTPSPSTMCVTLVPLMGFRMRNTDAVELSWSEPDGRWIADVLAQLSAGGRRIVERVPTSMLERGEQITLEMVTFKPDGRGPFPTLMFNHGSTGIGGDPSLFTSTVTSPALAKYFNDRGWMVVFPQRRGRGESGGLYDEGFEPDRSQYSDDPRHALPGFEHALVDMECIVEHMLSRDDVDLERLLIDGHSRGGLLALAFAGAHPNFLVAFSILLADGLMSMDPHPG